jgi:catechol 2,3-dioxygenase-like lactoylglutathione lyase family enzyme
VSDVRGIDHVNMRASAAVIEQLRSFYIDVVGLRQGPRPTFRSGSSGYWLYAGDDALVHLSVSRVATDDEPQPTGRFDHVAFACTHLGAMRARLDAAGVDYRMDEDKALDQVQLFLLDPAGIGIELNFRDVSRQER